MSDDAHKTTPRGIFNAGYLAGGAIGLGCGVMLTAAVTQHATAFLAYGMILFVAGLVLVWRRMP